ncbi:MAG: hypothetical protein K2P78_09425 [Gemmataceae bacterium]|nr:hypothetical protein [Gemmataceae bacterium]
MTIDTLASVKAALLVATTDDDTVLTRLADAAESFIAQHTGRAFAGGTFTETHPAGGRLLFLANFPVATVTDVRVDATRTFGGGTVRDATTYVLHAARGVIESLTGPFLPGGGPEAVQVTYTTATGAVPAAVKEALTQLVGHWYREAKTHADTAFRNLTELTSGTDTKTYPWGEAAGFRVPPVVLQLLAQFRVPHV